MTIWSLDKYGVSYANLLADLLWTEYQDAAKKARASLVDGDKLKALVLAIWAHKIKVEYDTLILG